MPVQLQGFLLELRLTVLLEHYDLLEVLAVGFEAVLLLQILLLLQVLVVHLREGVPRCVLSLQ